MLAILDNFRLAFGTFWSNPLRSFRGLLDHLATLTRNQVRFTGAGTDVPILTQATPDQHRAFHLIGAPIPLTAA